MGFDGSVRNVTVQIRLLDHVAGGFSSLVEVSALRDRLPLRRDFKQVVEDGLVIHGRRGPVELRLDSRQGSLRHIRQRVEDGDQVSVLNNLHAIDGSCTRRVRMNELRAVNRGPQNASVQQARLPDIPGIFGLAGDLGGSVSSQNVFADDSVFGLNLPASTTTPGKN